MEKRKPCMDSKILTKLASVAVVQLTTKATLLLASSSHLRIMHHQQGEATQRQPRHLDLLLKVSQVSLLVNPRVAFQACLLAKALV
jgi:hypothetical protein